jgi:hypothetical protein
MDTRIIISATLSFSVFLLLQFVVFRKINQNSVLVWLGNIFLIGSIFSLFGSIAITLFYPLKEFSQIAQFGEIFIISTTLYIFMVAIYVLGPFGLILSSLRIRLLEEVATAGDNGLTEQHLYRVYNINDIIQKRLDRFIKSKDFIYQNGFYIIKNRFSYFLIQAFLFENMKKIYQNDKK